MTINSVFVIDSNKKPLQPCSPATARNLLDANKAALFRRYPTTIIDNWRTLLSALKCVLPFDVALNVAAQFEQFVLCSNSMVKLCATSFDREAGQTGVHLRLCLGNEAVHWFLVRCSWMACKHEITAIPELLKLLEITIDAMGCHKAIAAIS